MSALAAAPLSNFVTVVQTHLTGDEKGEGAEFRAYTPAPARANASHVETHQLGQTSPLEEGHRRLGRSVQPVVHPVCARHLSCHPSHHDREGQVHPAANLYLMLTPTGDLAAMLAAHPDRAARLHQWLGNLTGRELRSEGRVYGGGLNKIEPKELARISTQSLTELWPELTPKPARQLELFRP